MYERLKEEKLKQKTGGHANNDDKKKRKNKNRKAGSEGSKARSL